MKTPKGKKRTVLLTRKEKHRIREAVARAEARSSGEIATMVVEQSDRYLEAERLGALLVAALTAAIVAVVTRYLTIWSYIPMVVVLFFPVQALFHRFPRLKLSFVGAGRQSAAVHERALASFYQKGLYRTRQETGILIYISLLERKVWILGDRGINARIAEGAWRELAGELALGLREGRAPEALCHTVDACGELLSRHFPRPDDDRNELPDRVLTP